MTIAGELARRIKAFRYDDIPDTAVTWAKVGILDTIGVTLAGAGEECVSIVKRVQGISEETDSGPCLILGGGRAGPLDAALINGTASHALDFDDFAGSIGGHPSVPLVPAIIALGEMTGASGRDAINAYVADFLGVANLLDAEHLGNGRVRLGDRVLAATGTAPTGPCRIVIRPERVRLVEASGGLPVNGLPVTVERRIFTGATTQVHLRSGDATFHALVTNDGREHDEGVDLIAVLPIDALRIVAED